MHFVVWGRGLDVEYIAGDVFGVGCTGKIDGEFAGGGIGDHSIDLECDWVAAFGSSREDQGPAGDINCQVVGIGDIAGKSFIVPTIDGNCHWYSPPSQRYGGRQAPLAGPYRSLAGGESAIVIDNPPVGRVAADRHAIALDRPDRLCRRQVPDRGLLPEQTFSLSSPLLCGPDLGRYLDLVAVVVDGIGAVGEVFHKQQLA